MKDLSPIFSPRSIAVIGASSRPGSVGWETMNSILRFGYTGVVYPINPKSQEISDLSTYASVVDVPDPVDLAVIVVKRNLVLPALRQCADQGVRGVVVITAGFKEVSDEGEELERQLTAVASEADIVLVGPNCMGVFNTDPGVMLNATFARRRPVRGPIGFISQSGAVGAAVLDYSAERRVGFSKFISIGNKSDVDENDALEAFADDDDVGVIALYLENFEDAVRFARICSEASRRKPVVVFKAGRSEAGARAASSHTGALAGSDAAVDALLDRCGAVRVDSIGELLSVTKFFSAPKRPRGSNLALITNAGGPGVIATDELQRAGFSFPQLDGSTVSKLTAKLPPEASCANPCDILPGSGAEGYRVAVEAIVNDPNVDALVVLFLPPIMETTPRMVEAIKPACERSTIPIIGIFMGASDVPADASPLEELGVTVYNSAPEVAQGLRAARAYDEWLAREILLAPALEVDREKARAILEGAAEGWLHTKEAFALLEAYGMPVVNRAEVRSGEDIVEKATGLHYPLAMKIISPDIIHKSDAGGVELDIVDADDLGRRHEHMLGSVRKAEPGARIDGVLLEEMAPTGTELIVGLKREPCFPPLLMCGLGGLYVEVLKDVVFRLAPLPAGEPERMLRSLRIAPILEGIRGSAGIDIQAAADVMTAVGQLAVDFNEIEQLDINPLIAGSSGCVVVDARIKVVK